ncbi:MAG: hypothetical protein JST54_31375 [Deltaproteobacteria bacterium]|nr:hypothetical protein [Deltaproteobacteria bacterium]
MKMVALVRPPPDLDAAVKLLAEAGNLTAAEARMRLAPEPPALLVRLEDATADALAGKLRAAKLAALAIGGPTAETLAPRTIELGADALKLTARDGTSMELPWSEIAIILRGTSASRESSERTETKKQFSATAAIVTGGLVMSTKTTSTARSSAEEVEQYIYVGGRDGSLAALRESVVDFTCLGKAMQPARTANVAALAQQLKAKAPGAFYDERLLRLGRRPLPFIGGEMVMSRGTTSTTRSDTRSGLELLVEVMRQAVAEKLLP